MDIDKYKINQDIEAKYVLLIDSDGSNLGKHPIQHCLDLAASKKLDLVQINDNSLPVCKILDYGKLKYESKKKYKEIKKNNKAPIIKELKLRPVIAQNDLDIKLSQIKDWLEKDHIIRISVWFKGREKAHIDRGVTLLQTIIDNLGDAIKPATIHNQDGKIHLELEQSR